MIIRQTEVNVLAKKPNVRKANRSRRRQRDEEHAVVSAYVDELDAAVFRDAAEPYRIHPGQFDAGLELMIEEWLVRDAESFELDLRAAIDAHIQLHYGGQAACFRFDRHSGQLEIELS